MSWNSYVQSHTIAQDVIFKVLTVNDPQVCQTYHLQS